MTWQCTTPQIGIADLTTVDTLSPGPVNLVGTNHTGRFPQLGSIVSGLDSTYGAGEFIYLAIPASTTLAAGTIVTFSNTSFTVSAMPTTSGNSGQSVAVNLNAITSSTSVQYSWFQIEGLAVTLKTAVAVPASSRLFVSGTAGRFYVTASAGKQILGARTANAATVTSTTSTVVVFINRPTIEGA